MATELTGRLIRLRNGLGFSQRELAKEFRVSPGAVGLWESGAREIPGPILKLMEAFEAHLTPSSGDEPLTGPDPAQLGELWSAELLNQLPLRGKDTTALRAKLSRSIASHLRSSLARDPIRRTVQISTYSRLLRAIERSRGVPLKLVQLASSLDPDMPAELRECLRVLQGSITAMPEGVAAKVIYQDLGQRPSRLFAEWEARPFAAASLGQVHRARLRSGELVAVKVQYPGIADELRASFEDPVIRELLSLLIRSGTGKMLDEFQQRVMGECDYVREASLQETYRAAFEGHPRIRVPRVFRELSTNRVLTSDFIAGRSFDEFLRTASQEAKNQVGMDIVRFQGVVFFQTGLVYADFHPGNLLFTEDQTAFIDFGRVIAFSPEDTKHAGELMDAVLENDPIRGRKLVELLGLVSDWRDFGFDGLWGVLREQHYHFLQDADFTFTAEYVSRKRSVMRSFRQRDRLQMNAPAFWNFFAISTQDALRAELGARANWRRLIRSSGLPYS